MSTPPSNSLAPDRLLIVDDDPGQRSLLASFLRGQGFATTTVESGGAAGVRLEDIEWRAIPPALAGRGFNRSVTVCHLGSSRRALLYKIARMRAEGLPVDFPGSRVEDRPAGGTL